MKASSLTIGEVILIEPRVFADDRGSFFESFNLNDFETATKLRPDFVQDNQSVSRRGVVRACTINSPMRKANWCAWCVARYLT